MHFLQKYIPISWYIDFFVVPLHRKLVFAKCALQRRQKRSKRNHFINSITYNTIMAYVISDDCIACGTCKDECPMGAISEGEHYSINPDICTECGTCADVCPTGAISKK